MLQLRRIFVFLFGSHVHLLLCVIFYFLFYLKLRFPSLSTWIILIIFLSLPFNSTRYSAIFSIYSINDYYVMPLRCNSWKRSIIVTWVEINSLAILTSTRLLQWIISTAAREQKVWSILATDVFLPTYSAKVTRSRRYNNSPSEVGRN